MSKDSTLLGSFLVPGKLYFKQGCLPVALKELKYELHKERIFIIADEPLLHGSGLTPVTRVLDETGLFWSAAGVSASTAQTCEKFQPDCIIAVGEYQATGCAIDIHKSYRNGSAYLIVIPTAIETLSVRRWLVPDMVILDEDLCEEPQGELTAARVLDAARQSLRGGNASDYTLAWAVKAMQIVFSGSRTKHDLLHAAALSRMAYAAAYSPKETAQTDLLPEAAQALGVSAETLEARITDAVKKRNS